MSGATSKVIDERVRIDIKDNVAEIRLCRSEKLNALDQRMFEAIVKSAAEIAVDETVRAIILSGEGKAFCAGIDLESLESLMSEEGKGRMLARTHGVANLYQQAAWAWRELPIPVIAVLQGVAFGGGLQIALGADMRFCEPKTKMSMMEVKWGIVPDMAGTILLRGLVREDVLRELVYTARIFEAAEAEQLGIVTKVCEDSYSTAMMIARSIARQSPRAVRAAKHLLNETQNSSSSEALLRESVKQFALLGGPDQREALLAYREKRDPTFQ
jgi:enoyl-CoA hydratase/carnithine racemase